LGLAFSEAVASSDGAFELFCPELLTALLFGPDWAGGFCADAALAAISAAPRTKIERFMCFLQKVSERSQPLATI
jgi:hypothetical protein